MSLRGSVTTAAISITEIATPASDGPRWQKEIRFTLHVPHSTSLILYSIYT